MHGEGPRFEQSAHAARDIVNLYIKQSENSVVLYSKILYRILDAIYAAEREMAELREVVSRN